MPRESDFMRRALKRRLHPALKALGFVGGPTHFRLSNMDCLDLLTIQYWKYGGEFILEFARCPRGVLVTSWGKTIEEDKLDVAYIGLSDRARLVQSEGKQGQNLHGFDYALFGEDEDRYFELATEVAEMLFQIDMWLEMKECGINVRPLFKEPDA